MDKVVVVGAGPTGLMLAGELALAGVPCRVLERRAAPSPESRGLVVHARTLETLDMRGQAERFVDSGFTVPDVNLFFARGSIDLSALPSRFPYTLVLPQSRTEELLEQHARALGAEVMRQVEVLGLEQDGSGVELRVRDDSGEWTERASYVVGCDGAHSTVRRLLNVPFRGSTYPTSFMLADVRHADVAPGQLLVEASRQGFSLVAPFGEEWFRLIVGDAARRNVPSDEPVTIEELRRSMTEIIGTDHGIDQPVWTSRFRTAHRQAERYRVGRAFLAGDAAHVHSPAGGQGLNVGIQDAFDLGWRLAADLRGQAAPGLLDGYSQERHRVGARVLRFTDALFRVATVRSRLVRGIRQLVAPVLLSIRPVQRRLAAELSGLAIAYPPRDGRHAHRLTGRRVPDVALPHQADGATRMYELLRAGRFVAVDRTTSGTVATTLDEHWPARMLTVHTPGTAADHWAPTAAAVLIRPDGYVAWATRNHRLADADTAALTRWLGPPQSRTGEGSSRATSARR